MPNSNDDAGTQAAAADQLPPRDKIIENLTLKMLKLSDVISEVGNRVPTSQDEAAEIEELLFEAQEEAERCEARIEVLVANGPFNDPGPEAEADLLEAMNEVDQATALGAATSALLAASHQLIQAYSAQGT